MNKNKMEHDMNKNQGITGWICILFFLVLAAFAANAQEPNRHRKNPGAHAAGAQESHLTRYRDFAYDDSTISDPDIRERVAKTIKIRIDTIYAVGLPQEMIQFLQKVPIMYKVPVDRGFAGHYNPRTKTVTLCVLPPPKNGVIKPTTEIVLLHELLHAYHHQMLGGFKNPVIIKFYKDAKTKHLFGPKYYGYNDSAEFFATTATGYLWASLAAKEHLKQVQPEFYDYLKKLFGPDAGKYVHPDQNESEEFSEGEMEEEEESK